MISVGLLSAKAGTEFEQKNDSTLMQIILLKMFSGSGFNVQGFLLWLAWARILNANRPQRSSRASYRKKLAELNVALNAGNIWTVFATCQWPP